MSLHLVIMACDCGSLVVAEITPKELAQLHQGATMVDIMSTQQNDGFEGFYRKHSLTGKVYGGIAHLEEARPYPINANADSN